MAFWFHGFQGLKPTLCPPMGGVRIAFLVTWHVGRQLFGGAPGREEGLAGFRFSKQSGQNSQPFATVLLCTVHLLCPDHTCGCVPFLVLEGEVGPAGQEVADHVQVRGFGGTDSVHQWSKIFIVTLYIHIKASLNESNGDIRLCCFRSTCPMQWC
mmetsp:Transcript_40644/g.70060  ORF Transcript_40644/g.70060 Transcript_40644/m.70060 type:complete len:155 (+) Transcript_40644:292-756(+)